MFNKDKWNELYEALSSNWARTLLTAFGVFWGIFILIILLSASNGMKNGIMKGFGGFATNTMFCWTQRTSMPYQGMESNRRFRYTLRDVEALKKIHGLKYVSPRDNNNSTVNKGLTSDQFDIMGDYPEYIKQDPLIIKKGRFINYGDIDGRRKICVIGTGVVKTLYKEDEKIIGSNLMINKINFLVVGIYKKETSNSDELNTLYIPFTTFQQIYNTGEKIGWMAITAVDDMPITNIKPKIISLLKKRHKVNPLDERAVGNFDLYKAFSDVQGLFGILTFSGYFVGFLVLMSGVIGVGNIMLIVVKERTKEIGIRRALGAQPRSIRLQILLESVALTLISGIIGIIAATGVIYAINTILDGMDATGMMFANPSVDLPTILISLMILILTGALSGMLPAQIAIKVRPVEALRIE